MSGVKNQGNRWVRAVKGAMLAATVSSLAATVQAQEFPTKPIRVVVPYPLGSSPDIVARIVSQHIPPLAGQSVIIDNRPGGGGVIGISELMRSHPDGYTLLAADQGQWAIYPAMQTNAPYDPVRDFAPVALVFTASPFFITRTSYPAKDMRELVAAARAKPGEVRYSSFGIGSVAHLGVETLAANLGGLKFIHVPYQGGVPAVEALLRGDVEFTVLTIGTVLPHLQAGKLRLLAVVSGSRVKAQPAIPTVAEAAGLPGYDFGAPAGWVARSGTPRAVLEKVAGYIAKIAQYPDVAERAASFGLEMTPSTPDQLAERIRGDVIRMAQAVKISGAKAE